MSNDAFTEWWQLSRTIFCTVRRIVVIPVTLVLFISIYQLCKHNNKMVKSNMATLCWCVCSLHPPQPILRRYKRVSFIAIYFFFIMQCLHCHSEQIDDAFDMYGTQNAHGFA